jgi:hypothetical protein
MTKTFTIDNFRVGDETFNVIAFPYPEHGEIDFEVYSTEGEYLFTVTSNRPELSTGPLWAYVKGLPTDAITFCTLWGN